MLSRRLLVTGFAAVLLSPLATATAKAWAEGGVVCVGQDQFTGNCKVTAGGGGDSGGTTNTNTGNGSAPGAGSAATKCGFTKDNEFQEVPCQSGGAYWSSARECYIANVSNNWPQDHQLWEGNTEGALFTCAGGPGAGAGMSYIFWAPSPPPGPAAPPDPRVLAQQGTQTMQLTAIKIGIVPEDQPGRVGLVGMPVWLWVADPGETTTRT